VSHPPAVVTGATGWLGSRLVELLAGGHPEVPSLAEPARDRRIACLVPPGGDPAPLRDISGNIEPIVGDLADPAALERLCAGAGGGTVFHVAGVIHPRMAAEFAQVNVEGTRRMLEAARKAGAKRFIHVSSNSPFGTNPSRDHVFDERSPYHPYMGYGRSKMEAELLVQSAAGLETVIVRPPWFYGPNQPPRQTLFFSMIRSGRMPIVGDGENRRSMGYVDNVCQGLMLAERVEAASGQAYWIADRRPYTMNEIVDTVERVLERDFRLEVAHRRLRLPGFASELAWLADRALQAAGLYHQKIHVLSEMNKTIACDVSKAERELGYAPTVALEEGMRRSIRWVLDRGLAI
jgi:nucleoside-diphosphate-sugar epimerase